MEAEGECKQVSDKGLPNVFEALTSIPTTRKKRGGRELCYYIDKANIGSQDVAARLPKVTVFPVLRTLPSPLVGHYWTLG